MIYGVIGAVLAFLGVAAGAFGAHGLTQALPPDRLAVFETGARYHIVHALALLFVAWATTLDGGQTSARLAGILFVAGTVVFSGSLYLLAVTGVRWLGAITPIGGVCFLGGWLALAWALSRGLVSS